MRSDKPFYYYLKASAICLTIIAAGVVTAFLVYTTVPGINALSIR